MPGMGLRIVDPVRTGESELAGGRLLGWAEWGPPDGIPVLLCPGAATSRRLGFGADVVDVLGVRLISVDRPGLGASTPVPGRSFGDFAADIGEFTARREIERPAMVGFSQGAPFALACAAEGVAGALAVVSGADEVAAPEFAGLLPAQLRALVARTVAAPAGAEEFFAAFDPGAIWDMVLAGSAESDLEVYREPGFERAYRRAVDEAFVQGPAGYARDTVLAMGRWTFDPARITVAVDVWYGEQDTSHSPDQGALLASRVPGAVRRVVPGIGGAVLWTHAEEILRSLTGNLPARR